MIKPQYPPPAQPSQAVGIGLRHPHYEDILTTPHDIGWIEVHPENYFGGGAHRHFLSKAREKYQLSFHAIGLSLGADQPVSVDHLRQFKELIDIYDPFHVSDHASWSASGNAHLNDLLPLPYTEKSLTKLADNVDQTQSYFGRTMLVENPSTYVAFKDNDMSEAQFMNALAARTGCGLLLDINNIYVQAVNHGFDAFDYIDTINKDAVFEIHLAGHTERDIDGVRLLIDTHSKPVCEDVWSLYAHAAVRFGAVPTLIEWDSDIPHLDVLVAEADKARAVIEKMTVK